MSWGTLSCRLRDIDHLTNKVEGNQASAKKE